jgi:cation transport protein ChaC
MESQVRVRLTNGAWVLATTFLSDTTHPQWAGALSLEAQAQLIAGARGLSGANIDYLRDLTDHLRAEGVSDPAMEHLLTRVDDLEAALRPSARASER